MLDKTGRYQFLAEPFHCDVTGRLFLGSLGNLMLNAADFHSSERSYGMRQLGMQHKTWVLSRLAVEMEAMPEAYTPFVVETWIESVMRYFTNRNFRVVGTDGRVYGYGRSVWAMIDTVTRQPQDILAVNDGEITRWTVADKECPIARSSRVKMGGNARLARTVDIAYNDIDMNGHVNSVKYIEHVLDLFPVDRYKERGVRRIEMAYVAESHYGDRLALWQERAGESEYNIRLTKTVGADAQPVEVARCKVKFG